MTPAGGDPAKRISWPTLFRLWALQGVLALWRLAAFPSDRESTVLFGFSAARLAGALLLLAWVVLTAWLSVSAQRDPAWRQRRLDALFGSHLGDALLVAALVMVIAAEAALAILWGLSRRGLVLDYVVYASRLTPLLNLAALVGLEFIGWMIYQRREIFNSVKAAGMDVFKRALALWTAVGLLAIFVMVTGLGIVPDETGDWGLPAVALLEWQILLACLCCLALLFVEAGGGVHKIPRLDLWVSIAVWLGTVLLWLSQPVNPAFSALPPRAPNYEVYPFFDAQVYDEHAQAILIGNGMQGGEIPSRPLYIVFLAFLHMLVGQDYDRVIAAQSVVLALFPVGLYWMGKEFYGRPVGVAMALLAALRDYTSNIAAPFTYALSYSKLYLSEIPVAISLVLFILVAMRWARNNYPGFSAFLAGGILGVGIMIRTQAVMALPVVLLIAWLMDRKQIVHILRGAILILVAIGLVVSPWIWRNWQNTGQLIFDSPQTQTINLALRYSNLNGVAVDVSRGPRESNAEYNDRLIRIFVDAVAANPGGAASVLANRFLNNCVDNVLLFPLRNDLLDADELFRPGRAFWEQWRGRPTLGQRALIAFYLFLLGLGLAAAWKRIGLWAFAPLGVNLLYNFWTSIALLSGQRFLLSMDWSIYMYYMIGLFVLINGFLFLLHRARPWVVKWYGLSAPPVIEHAPAAKPSPQYVMAGLIFLLVGASIPLGEKLIPKRYPPVTQEQLFHEFVSSPAFDDAGLDASCLQELIAQHDLVGSSGRALSPRYYGAGEGEPTAKLGYAVADEPRMLFLTTGNRYGLAIINLAEAPDFFPHASDVIVYTERAAGHKAWLVLVKDAHRQEVYVSEELRSGKVCGQPP